MYSESFFPAGFLLSGKVSIPFKRESVFRAAALRLLREEHTKFQFPSNGKVYSEISSGIRRYHPYGVSIPFKRESVFRESIVKSLSDESEFQFPSNGKVYSEIGYSLLKGTLSLFQFPSNGKVYSENLMPENALTRSPVSIPFKRESVFRGYTAFRNGEDLEFQFPSNGKVYSELPTLTRPTLKQACFNSLQTGKCIQRWDLGYKKPGGINSFNSLQTGKCIQRRTTRT